MATAKQLRDWCTAIRRLLAEVDDSRVTEFGSLLIGELEELAGCEEVAERQFV
jgi:hypothetical protein